MKCTICDKDNSWLSYIGKDYVCSKCIVKHTIFKEIRFSDEKRLKKVLRRRKLNSFDDLKNITEKDFEQINLEKDDPHAKKYKEQNKEDVQNKEENNPPVD